MGLRDPLWGHDPFVFARSFVMAYAGVTDAEARRAVDELERFGSIVRHGGENGRAILRRPGPTLFAVLGSEEAVMDELIEAFDAEEIS